MSKLSGTFAVVGVGVGVVVVVVVVVVAGCSLKPIRNFSGRGGGSFWFGGGLVGRCQRRHRYVLGVEMFGFGVATFGHGGVFCVYDNVDWNWE